jgi:hypothetical protein
MPGCQDPTAARLEQLGLGHRRAELLRLDRARAARAVQLRERRDVVAAHAAEQRRAEARLGTAPTTSSRVVKWRAYSAAASAEYSCQ